MLRQDLKAIALHAEQETQRWNVNCRVIVDVQGLLIVARRAVRDKVCSRKHLIPWVELSAQYGNPVPFVNARIDEVLVNVQAQVDKAMHKN